jgi:disulfide oxidoreductase YuzD
MLLYNEEGLLQSSGYIVGIRNKVISCISVLSSGSTSCALRSAVRRKNPEIARIKVRIRNI